MVLTARSTTRKSATGSDREGMAIDGLPVCGSSAGHLTPRAFFSTAPHASAGGGKPSVVFFFTVRPGRSREPPMLRVLGERQTSRLRLQRENTPRRNRRRWHSGGAREDYWRFPARRCRWTCGFRRRGFRGGWRAGDPRARARRGGEAVAVYWEDRGRDVCAGGRSAGKRGQGAISAAAARVSVGRAGVRRCRRPLRNRP